MPSENEKVAEIVKEMRDRNEVRKVRLRQYGGVQCSCSIAPDDVPAVYADRIEAAHRRDIAELVAALKALADDACGHCDARYCQNTCHNGEPVIPCRVVYEAQALVRKYSPPEKETPPESDDGMPF